MATTTTIIKYDMSGAGGTIGQQPFKIKAKFEELSNWKFTDKLNKLEEFTWSVPNDDFHRANAIVERKAFVPFLKPFHGFVTKKAIDENNITLTAKEFSTHLERRSFLKSSENKHSVTTKDWIDSAWKFRRKIVINKNNVPFTMHNVPILFRTPDRFDVGFPLDLSLSQNAQSTGNDIIFTEKDGKTIIPHEIENYSGPGFGELEAWVKVPEISTTSNEFIYMYYGNLRVSGSQEQIAETWKDVYEMPTGASLDTNTPDFDHHFSGVWHLNESGNPRVDSTEEGNDGTGTSVTPVSGHVHNAVSFDGVAGEINCGSLDELDDFWSEASLLTAWINPSSDGEGDEGTIVSKCGSLPIALGWRWYVLDEVNGFVKLGFQTANSTADGTWESTARNIPIGKFTHVAMSYDNDLQGPDDTPVFWINGVRLVVDDGITETVDPNGVEQTDTARDWKIGNILDDSRTFDGIIDEVRAMDRPPGKLTDPSDKNKDKIVKNHFESERLDREMLIHFPQEQYLMSARKISQQIIDSANADMPVTWILDDDFAGTEPLSFRVSTSNLIAHFEYDGGISDHWGVNQGTLTGGVLNFVPFRIGTGFQFDGFNAINHGSNGNVNFAETDDMSVSFYYQSTNLSTVQGLVTRRVISDGEGWSIKTDATGKLIFAFEDGIAGVMSVDSGTTLINDGSPHTILCTKTVENAPAGMTVYIDGVDVSANRTGSALAATSVTELLMVGGQGATPVDVVDSSTIIDDVYIYNVTLILQDAIDIHDLPNNMFTGTFNFMNHYDALQSIAEVVQKDVFFDNKEHIIFMGIKGKTFDPNTKLDIVITTKPEISVDDFANQINLLGKIQDTGEQLENASFTDTVLRFNYERTISDSQLTQPEQLKGVGDQLLKEFQKLTPQIKGVIPYQQFIRLDLRSGDIIKISEPKKELNQSFRVMEIEVNAKQAKITLESTETGVIRLRSLSFTDIIEGILKRSNDQSILS